MPFETALDPHALPSFSPYSAPLSYKNTIGHWVTKGNGLKRFPTPVTAQWARWTERVAHHRAQGASIQECEWMVAEAIEARDSARLGRSEDRGRSA